MKYTLLILLILFAISVRAQYIPNSSAYQWPGGQFLNSLQIPTGCGLPTNANAPDQNRAAIYFDSCSGKTYRFDPAPKTWIEVTTGGPQGNSLNIYNGDSSLAGLRTVNLNSFGLRFQQDGLDWINLDPVGRISRIAAINGTTYAMTEYNAGTGLNSFITAASNGTNVISIRGSAPLNSIVYSAGLHNFNGVMRINTEDGAVTDSILVQSGGIVRKIAPQPPLDTATMLLPYLRKTDAAATYLGLVDTANMLAPYTTEAYVDAGLALKLNLSDTAAMLFPYLRKVDLPAPVTQDLQTTLDAGAILNKNNTITNPATLHYSGGNYRVTDPAFPNIVTKYNAHTFTILDSTGGPATNGYNGAFFHSATEKTHFAAFTNRAGRFIGFGLDTVRGFFVSRESNYLPFRVDTAGQVFTPYIVTKNASHTKSVFINPTTGQLASGDPPAGGGVNASAQRLAIGQSATTLTYAGAFYDTAKNWLGINTTTPQGITDFYPTFTGTVSTILNSPVVTGTNTRFQDLFKTGDSIFINGTTYYNILSIASQTSLTLTTNAGADLSGVPYANPSTGRGVWMLRENGTVWQYGYPFIRNNTAYRNLAFGTNALTTVTTGTGNIALGYEALNVNTTGQGNTAFGNINLALNIDGSFNTAGGYAALANNTSGLWNTAWGYSALYGNLTGQSNIAVGGQTLNANLSGSNNVAAGHGAMYLNTTGSNNVAVGYNAYRNGNNGNNTAIGFQALSSLTGGYGNTGVGYDAGRLLANGVNLNETTFNSGFIGRDTKASADGVNNEWTIGFGATGSGSNTTTIGNTATTATYLKGTLYSQGNINAFAAKTSAYTITATDQVIKADATGGAFNVTLPTAVGRNGQVYSIIKVDSSLFNVTVNTTASQTINSVTTYALSARYEAISVVSDGANWLLSGGRVGSKRVRTITTSAAPTPNARTEDAFTITALAATTTIGSPGAGTEMQELTIRIKDNGTPRDINWNAIYRAGIDLPLPRITSANRAMYLKFYFHAADQRWDLVGFLNGF